MQPGRAAGRLMRMKNELRLAAGLVPAVALAGCGATSPQPQPQPQPVMAHGMALREPLVSPRPYGAAGGEPPGQGEHGEPADRARHGRRVYLGRRFQRAASGRTPRCTGN